MDRSDQRDFLDMLYDAALDPALWVPVMERFADLVGGSSACISQLNMVDGSGSVMISRTDPAMLSVYFEHFAQRNPLSNVDNPAAYLRGWVPRILTDEDWMPKEDLVRTEYYNDFQKPQDVHSALMIRLAKRDPDISVLNVARPLARGQFDGPDLELAARLHPDLIRAFNLSQNLAEVQHIKSGMADALDRSQHGLFLIDDAGRVHHANRAAESLVSAGRGLTLIGGQLGASTPDATRRLQALIAQAAGRDRGRRRGGSMAVPTPFRRLPLSLTVAPLRSERFGMFLSTLTAIVCVTDLESGASMPEQTLRNLFGLTAAEARVAVAFFEGCTSKEAAENLGLSFHTVRVQLARIFEKTQTNRQADLVRLMMNAVGVDVE